MSNPPKKKGTGFETERVNTWLADGRVAKRMPQGAPYDNHINSLLGSVQPIVIEALTFRADRGEAMTLITHDHFRYLANIAGVEVHEECKRPARSSVYTTFRKKFPR